MHSFTVRNTVFLTGWLFADLLLGLMAIFMVSLPGAQPPTMTVNPLQLKPQSSQCTTGQNDTYSCSVVLGETKDSLGTMTWSLRNDISQDITFSPSHGTLSPGQTVTITISTIPCQTGSFTFSGSDHALPVSVFWECDQAPLKLDLNPRQYDWQVSDPTALLNNDARAINELHQQATRDIVPIGRRVGLIIVYAGAPSDNDTPAAARLSNKVADLLINTFGQQDIPALKDASSYSDLHLLGSPPTTIRIDAFFFNR